MRPLFAGALEKRRAGNLRALTKAEFQAARGAAHLRELREAADRLENEREECRRLIPAHQQEITHLENELRQALSIAVQRHAASTFLREVDGMTPELRDVILNQVFKTGLSDLENIPERPDVTPELQGRISNWATRYRAWLPMLSNQSYPGKDELVRDYHGRIAARREAIERLTHLIDEIGDILKHVQDEIDSLSAVSLDDLVALRSGERVAVPRVEHFLRGVYAEWERPPDWYQRALRSSIRPAREAAISDSGKAAQ